MLWRIFPPQAFGLGSGCPWRVLVPMLGSSRKYHARVCECLDFQFGGVSLITPLQGQVPPPKQMYVYAPPGSPPRLPREKSEGSRESVM